MFFIYGTDAPLYHYPIVTVTMMVVNTVVHALIVATGLDVLPYILAFGDGYHPVQWLTHNFLHADWIHLIGNLIFLFPFGLVVEGKIGWLRMLVLYLAIGIGQGFAQQTIMLPSDPGVQADELVAMFDDPENPMDDQTKAELRNQWRTDLRPEDFGSLGASAVIFGLLAVCVLWAPLNHFEVYFRWSLFISAPDGGIREWPISTVAGIFVAKEAFMFWLSGMAISSEALHLNGFIVGGGFGLAMLMMGWVDCEGYDLVSHWSGQPYKPGRVIEKERAERAAALQSLLPQGPPQVVVPKMAHQMAHPAAATKPVATPVQEVVSPMPNEVPPSEVLPGSLPAPLSPPPDGSLFDDDLGLPEFDDGAVAVDPLDLLRRSIEATVARGQYAAAIKELAAARKQHSGFVVSPPSIDRLAEGLISIGQAKPARALLEIGCRSHPAYESTWRIRIAQIHLDPPSPDAIAAIKQLRRIDKDTLDSRLRALYVETGNRAREIAGA